MSTKGSLAPLIIRTEAHALSTTPEIRADVERTIAFYRRVVRMAATVAMTHWPELGPLRSMERLTLIESMFHATKDRPVVRYAVLGRALGKMPSYLRRAAINASLGAVSSFLSNYSLFLDGDAGGKNSGKKREVGARPPKLGFSNVFPSLYGGNMILVGVKNPAPKVSKRAIDQPDFVGPMPFKNPKKPLSPKRLAKLAEARQAKLEDPATPHGYVRVKVLGEDGQWRFTAPLKLHGKVKRMLPTGEMDLSPTLMLRGAKTWLSCPVKVRPPKYITNKAFADAATPSRVCSVDVGINTAATLAIVDSTGTVIARTFLTCGRHNDQRDRLGEAIAEKRSLSGSVARGERHTSALHERISGISLDAARQLASQIAAFAAKHEAKAIVIEDLKGWRPKGPSKKMRQRFHRFQHRMLVKHLTFKAQELGMRVLEIFARGTSRYAYDGSGKVSRSKDNAQLATFASGKKYNADLNGALNIAARGLAMLLGVTTPERAVDAVDPLQNIALKARTGKSSGRVERMPLVLADIWNHAKSLALGVASVVGGSSNHQLSSGVAGV